MNKTKYILIFILTLVSVEFIAMEYISNGSFLFSLTIILGFIGFVFILIPQVRLIGKISLTLFSSLICVFFLAMIIGMAQTDIAYSKITSIPKDNLIQYYETKDINLIPKKYRYTWIGAFYRKIDIVPRNRVNTIKAVGWRHNTVFSYYDIEEDDYVGSYH